MECVGAILLFFILRLVSEGARFLLSKHGVALASDHISASIMALQDVQTGPSDDMYNFLCLLESSR